MGGLFRFYQSGFGVLSTPNWQSNITFTANFTALNIEDLYQIFLEHPSIQIDTRKLKAGDLFFALSGERFNGNSFALQALALGASYAIVDEDIDPSNQKIIVVNNVLETLQALAKHHRQQFKIPFIAITGSNGKTTTKELVYTVLSSQYKTYTTQGNYNNHIGVPLTLLSIGLDAEMAVVEMGANHQQEIAGYCQYTMPTHGIITNCGKAHLEGFGGIEGVKKGKGELFDYLKQHNGTAFIYTDYDYLNNMSNGITTIIGYGSNEGLVTGKSLQSEPFLQVQLTGQVNNDTIITNLVGNYNLPNVLCAVAVGQYFGVPQNKIKQALENYHPSNSRSQLIEVGTNKIILDAYNANPTSTKAAIENLAKISAQHKIVMLGGMMELGETSAQEHKEIVKLINTYKWDHVVLVGGDFSKIDHPYIYFDNAAEAGKWFGEQQFSNSYILIKGSRSIKMEDILLKA